MQGRLLSRGDISCQTLKISVCMCACTHMRIEVIPNTGNSGYKDSEIGVEGPERNAILLKHRYGELDRVVV